MTASVRGGTLKVSRKGVATVRVGGGPGSGKLELRARLKRRAVRIGAAAVELRTAGEARVAVKLSKAARRALKRGRLKATATLTLRDAGGRTATGKAALKLKARR